MLKPLKEIITPSTYSLNLTTDLIEVTGIIVSVTPPASSSKT
jgi:hypothetical protein